jgi:tetratricopeptide (TPR) repeat protein
VIAGERESQAAGLLVKQAWTDYVAGRYRAAVAAATRAAEAARQLDDVALLARALNAEAGALTQLGDSPAALARYTQILGLAEDPATRGHLDDDAIAEVIAAAHWNWVHCARFVPGIPVRELFTVLDAAQRWLAATGHSDWRAAVLSERAQLHQRLGEAVAAVAAAEEALAVALQHPDAPGHTLASHRFMLGDMLRAAGRAEQAVPHYQAVLADPAVSGWSRLAAHQGLAKCALAASDLAAGHREARTAVLLAEPLGDEALCPALEALTQASRAAGDLTQAWQVTARYLETAGRTGGRTQLYYATRTAVDVALDRADLPAARRLLSELAELAAALDVSADTTISGDAVQERRQRLAGLEEAPPGPLGA